MKTVLLLSLLLGAIPVLAADAKVTSLMTKPLADFPGKEAEMITVEYPPGSSDPIHKHNAHAFVYVLEGSIVMAVNGGEPVTLTPGQTFYEGPTDIHTIGRNASQTQPAKFVVLLIKNENAPILVPVK
jgi:quercetin dioxygenase-like cupin family protein